MCMCVCVYVRVRWARAEPVLTMLCVGVLRRGDFIVNSRDGRRIKVPRLVRMHSDEMEDVTEVRAGEICALFGLEVRTAAAAAEDE